MFVFNPKKLKKSTLWFVGIVAGGTLGFQVEAVKNFFNPILANHPHCSSLVTGICFVLTALHNPKVQAAITDLFQEEQVPALDGGTTVKKTIIQEVKTPPDDV